MEIVLVSVILVATIVLLVTEILPTDVTALAAMVALMVTGLLPASEAVAGFAHPAPITVGALFVVTQGLVRTGALGWFSERIIAATRGRRSVLLLLLLGLVGVLSAFVNNTPIVVLFIGVAMAACCNFNLSPSKLLIPISFMSILAGTTTLIGTSTNIIVSDVGHSLGAAPIGMFELSALGLPIALLGGVFLFFLSDRLLPGHKEPVCEVRHGERHKYISELQIHDHSRLLGTDPREALARVSRDIELYEVLRGMEMLDPARDDVRAEPGDILLVKATAGDLVEVLDRTDLRLARGGEDPFTRSFDDRAVIVELIVPPASPLVGRRLLHTDLASEGGSKLLGVKRRRVHYSAQMLANLRLSVGDILLVQCPMERIEQVRASGDLIVLEDVRHRIVKRRRAPIALVAFLGMILAAATGLTGILEASLAAALVMVLGGCLSMSEAYRAVDVRVLVLIIGTIALGRALQSTGAADVYARGFLSLFEGLGPHAILAAFVVLTSVLSHFLSNNSTAVLLVPIGFSTAAALGVDARPFLVGICFGASACYASPIGYQTNLLVYGPGGYRFKDYLRVGMPLNALVWVSASIGIPLLWPF